jgi:hypothetical protein
MPGAKFPFDFKTQPSNCFDMILIPPSDAPISRALSGFTLINGLMSSNVYTVSFA